MATQALITPFKVNVPDAELDDLRNHLRRTRLAPEFANDDWHYGANGAYLKEFLHYWETAYDWRQHEAAINAQPNFMTSIDGIPIHFIHARGKGPKPVPLRCIAAVLRRAPSRGPVQVEGNQ